MISLVRASAEPSWRLASVRKSHASVRSSLSVGRVGLRMGGSRAGVGLGMAMISSSGLLRAGRVDDGVIW